ncbi:serine/threonine-protein kinase [Nannocystaceae bacterium ST9]
MSGAGDGKPDDVVARPARVNRFTLLEPIAKGGMGELHAAYDAQLDRKIALKLVRPGRGGPVAEGRLLREAQALAKLSHPNVVTVYEAGIEGDRVFVAMEYVRGQTLTAWLAQSRSLPEPERVAGVLACFGEAARGLAGVHEAGLAHRDFKPDNVLVGADGRVRVVDFGLARRTVEVTGERLPPERTRPASATESDSGRVESMPTPDIETVTGTILGTPRYMAPEQWEARRGDSRSDQFSFCVALYWALFGSWPFGGEGMTGLRTAVLAGVLREPPRKPVIPARLLAALLRGLSIDPGDRFLDMSELIAAIDQARAPKRRRVGAWLTSVGVGFGLALALVIGLRRSSAPPLVVAPLCVEVEREIVAEHRRAAIDEQIATLTAAGEHAEADAVFEAFAGQREYANTRALTRAWLDHARRLHARGEAQRELVALGEAQLVSPSEDLREQALIELARVFVAGHHYEQLAATLRLLDLDSDDPARRRELAVMAIREASSRRDFAGALEILREPGGEGRRDLEPLFEQLGRARLSEHVATASGTRGSTLAVLPTLDRDGDQQGELVFVSREGKLHLLGSSPELPVLQELDVDVEPGPLPTMLNLDSVVAAEHPDMPDWVLADLLGQGTLLELSERDDRVVARALPIESVGVEWATGDLVAAWPGVEAWGADTLSRRMVGLRHATSEPASLERFDPEPTLANLRSVVQSVVVVDLDGDGHDELVAGVGAWWAYDVRVLTPQPASPGRFELAARRKLGAIEGLVGFPTPGGIGRRIAVSLPSTPPSPRVFPSDARSGEPSGVVVLAWAGEGRSLEIVDRVALPSNFRPSAGDLDGDGRSELVVQTGTGIAVLRLDADERYEPFVIEGLWYHALVDLDGDGDDELIVSELDGEADRRLVVLGSGDQRMGLLERTPRVAVEPPAELDPTLVDMWRKAESLAMIGLSEPASAAFDALARLAGPDAAALAHRRAAEVAERGGVRQRAAESYEQAGDRDSLERALAHFERSHRFADALRVARRLVESEDLDEAARAGVRMRVDSLERLATPTERLEFDFDAPLDEGWRIARPGLLRRQPGGLGVECLSTSASDRVLVRRPIVWEGGRLELEIDLELVRLEWASALSFALFAVDEAGVAEGPPLISRRIGSWGGGDHYMLDLNEGLPVEDGGVGVARSMQGAQPPEGQRRFRLRLDLLAGVERSWSTITTIDGTGPRDTAFELEQRILGGPLEPGRYELRLLTSVEPWMRGEVRLERLRLLGARDDPEAAPPTRRERVLLALANAEHEQALALLDAAEPGELEPRDAAWLRVLALDQLGRWSSAVPFIEQAIGDCEGPEALARFGQAMLLQPDRVGPTLRRICTPERFLLATWAVTQVALYQHKDLADLHRTLTTQLGDLDRYEPRELDQALAVMGLLTSRARGWLMQDAASAAEADLRRVIALSRARLADPSLTPAEREDILRIGSLAHVELAVVSMSRDGHDAAAIELAEALALDPAPEIIADVIAARTVFDVLKGSPLWATVARAQLGLWRGTQR